MHIFPLPQNLLMMALHAIHYGFNDSIPGNSWCMLFSMMLGRDNGGRFHTNMTISLVSTFPVPGLDSGGGIF
jgi:hypothetical protein